MNNSPIFVFDIDGRVIVYDDVNDAEQSLEAVDVNDNEYPVAYDVKGRAYQVLPHLDNARLVPLEQTTNIADLRHRLSRAYGPRHLADRPADYANEVLTD
jgi:hypothetical protein